eukprot:Clim_evm82s108 gene=Clim_evmTU82s108
MASLVVPLAIWNHQKPEHEVTCVSVVYATRYILDPSKINIRLDTERDRYENIVCGLSTGQICVWRAMRSLDGKPHVLEPFMYLFGHTRPVTCVCPTSAPQVSFGAEGRELLVSADAGGELRCWDPRDGRCLSANSRLVDGRVRCLAPVRGKPLVAIGGEFLDVIVVSAPSLQVMYTLRSVNTADWTAALTCGDVPTGADSIIGQSVVMSVSQAGALHVWGLEEEEPHHDLRSTPQRKSDTSQSSPSQSTPARHFQIPLFDRVVDVAFGDLRSECFAIVCPSCWFIYSSRHFKRLCTIKTPFQGNQQLSGLHFVGLHQCIVYTADGQAALYNLPDCLIHPADHPTEEITSGHRDIPRVLEFFCFDWATFGTEGDHLVATSPRPSGSTDVLTMDKLKTGKTQTLWEIRTNYFEATYFMAAANNKGEVAFWDLQEVSSCICVDDEKRNSMEENHTQAKIQNLRETAETLELPALRASFSSGSSEPSNSLSKVAKHLLVPPEPGKELYVGPSARLDFGVWYEQNAPQSAGRDDKENVLTYTIFVEDEYLVQGYDSGDITISPISVASTELLLDAIPNVTEISNHNISESHTIHGGPPKRQDSHMSSRSYYGSINLKKAHHGKVTCLYFPQRQPHSSLNSPRRLESGHGPHSPAMMRRTFSAEGKLHERASSVKGKKHSLLGVQMPAPASADHQNLEKNSVFISGGADHMVKVWRVRDGQPMYAYNCHSAPIESIFAPPVSSNNQESSLNTSVCVVGADHTLSVVSYQMKEVIFNLTGHAFPIHGVYFNYSQGVIMVRCLDESLYCWQMGSGHLDRVVIGQRAFDMMANVPTGMTHRIDVTGSKRNYMKNVRTRTKHSMEVFALPLADGIQPVQLILVDIKRLIHDVYAESKKRGEYAQITPTPVRSSIPIPYDVLQSTKASFQIGSETASSADDPATDSPRNNGSTVASSVGSPRGSVSSNATPKKQRKKSLLKRVGSRKSLRKKGQPLTTAPEMDLAEEGASQEYDDDESGMQDVDMDEHRPPAGVDSVYFETAAHLTFSALLSWGLDEHLDATAQQNLGLYRPLGSRVSYGIRGVSGGTSVMLPRDDFSLRRWKVSEYVSCLHQLSLMSLARALMTADSAAVKNDWSQIIAFYYGQLKTQVPGFIRSSPVGLCQFLHDTQQDVQQSARTILLSNLKSFDTERRLRITDGLLADLSMSSEDPTPVRNLAIVLLGMILAHFPDDIDNVRAQAIVTHLMHMMSSRDISGNDSHAPSTPMITLGENSVPVPSLQMPPSNQPNVGSAVTGMLQNQQPVAGLMGGQLTAMFNRLAAAELLGLSIRKFASLINVNVVTSTLVDLAGQARSDPKNIAKLIIARLARQAIVYIAEAQPQLLLKVLQSNVAKHDSGKATTALKIIATVLKRNAYLFANDLELVVDLIMKTIDPNLPRLREACVQDATVVLHECIRHYNNVSFHSATQRFAVASGRQVIIYDVRTASRYQVVENPTPSPITAVTLSMDGQSLATYSLQDSQMRCWSLGHTFFSMFSSPKPTKTVRVQSLRTKLTEKQIRDNINMVCVSETTVVLLRGEGVPQVTFNIA